MKTKKKSNVCLYFEKQGRFCKHYIGDKDRLESCRNKCNKLKQRKVNN